MKWWEAFGSKYPLVLLLVVTGCRTSASKRTITVIPRDTAEEIWVSEHGGAADSARRRHLDIYWNGPSHDDDVEQQIALSELAIDAHNYGLILSPNNPFALNTMIQRAISHQIPVVIVGAQIPLTPEKGLSFVLGDADELGLQAARRLRQILKGKGKIIVLGVDSLSPGSVERANAFEEALHQEAPGITIVDKVAGPFSFGQAEQASELALSAHPNIRAIFALGINDTRGAAAAIRSLGQSGRIKIIGCDQTLDLLLLLREGIIDSLIVEDTRKMGSIAVEQIAAEKSGQSVPARTLVKPILVTGENVDYEGIQEILSLRWRPQQ